MSLLIHGADNNAKETQMRIEPNEDLFSSPESIISTVLAADEANDPGLDFELDPASDDWGDASVFD